MQPNKFAIGLCQEIGGVILHVIYDYRPAPAYETLVEDLEAKEGELECTLDNLQEAFKKDFNLKVTFYEYDICPLLNVDNSGNYAIAEALADFAKDIGDSFYVVVKTSDLKIYVEAEYEEYGSGVEGAVRYIEVLEGEHSEEEKEEINDEYRSLVCC